MLIDYILLFLGLAWVTFLPGYALIESFFSSLPRLLKFPLYFLLSVILSTYVSYFAMLWLGYQRNLLIFLAGITLVWFGVALSRKKFILLPKEHLGAVLLALLVYAIFFICLYVGIFQYKDGAFTMAGPNWQDTAMHLSIIETIANGNWPPQAPYFSGQPLSYYYFVDFQAALVNILFGQFFPQILVFLNPFFAGLFTFSIYALAFTITKSKKVGWVASLLAVFYGNLGFTSFLREWFASPGRESIWLRAKELLSAKGYGLEYGQVLQVSPMADYFLQNRPMMFALPLVAMVIVLLIYALKKKQAKFILLAGVLVGSLVKFQIFGLVVCGIIAGLTFLFWFHHLKLKKSVLFVFIFSLSILAFFCFSGNQSVAGRSFVDFFKETLVWGPWDQQSFFWYLRFIFLNFGFYLPLFLFSILLILFKKKINEKEREKRRGLLTLFALGGVLFTLPFLMRFTVYGVDMLKFFYFFIIPASVLGAYVVVRLQHIKVLGTIFLIMVLVVSLSTSTTTLLWSYFNKDTGYSQAEYSAGLWIRENTPSRSVFLTMPTVHCAISEIGGRLRVISYITWPYSHGFNVGEDNVFARRDDMEVFYQSPSKEIIQSISQKYQAKYIYYGHEERQNFPGAGVILDEEKMIKKIYNAAGISIYEIL